MAEQFSEQVEILDTTGNVTIALDATKAQVKLGGHERGGDVNLFASGDSDLTILNAKIRLDGEEARVRLGGNGEDGTAALYPASETSVGKEDRASILLNGKNAYLRLGGNGINGDVALFPKSESPPDKDRATIYLSGRTGSDDLGSEALVRLGGNGVDGDLRLYDSSETATTERFKATIHLNGHTGDARLGGSGVHGNIRLYSAYGKQLGDPTQASILLDGSEAYLQLGGNDLNGAVALFPSGETPSEKNRATIYLDAIRGNIRLGGNGKDGDLKLFPADVSGEDVTDDHNALILLDGSEPSLRMGGGGHVALFRGGHIKDDTDEASIYLDADYLDVDEDRVSYIRCGGNDLNGILELFPPTDYTPLGLPPIKLDAEDGLIRVGGAGIDGQVAVLDKDTNTRITLDGSTGQILFENADVAEQFNVGPTALAPGTVVAFVDEETVIPATDPYDPRVAGVIAGAGGYRPGMVLGYIARGNRQAVSVFGKACCMVDASYGPIRTGDLLVISPTPGHAMRATDRSRAFGATLGKALRDFDGGCGMIPVLITLR